MNKEERQAKFLKEHPDYKFKAKTYHSVQYPDLNNREIGVLGEIKKRGEEWGRLNHSDVFDKIAKYL